MSGDRPDRASITADAMAKKVGEEIGVSDWVTITQAMIDAFADVTDDHQFIHVDPARARETPFGGPIAHGFLVLSLLSAMAMDALPKLTGSAMGVNYGFDRVRFANAVPADGRVRGRFVLLAAEEKRPGEITLRYRVTVELDGAEKPAVAADWITRQYRDV